MNNTLLQTGKFLCTLFLLASWLIPLQADDDNFRLTYSIANNPAAAGPGSVTVEFTLTLRQLCYLPGAAKEPYYQIHFEFGDNTYLQDTIRMPAGSALAAGCSNTDSITYTITHIYSSIPAYAPEFKASAIYSDIEDPPPARTSNGIKSDLQNLGLLNLNPITSTSGANLFFQLSHSPVPGNEMIGILEYKGLPNAVIDSGSIAIFYNLSAFTERRLEVDTFPPNVRTHFGEIVEHHIISADDKPSVPDYQDYLLIKFTDLQVNEHRKVFINFDCPASMTADTNQLALFHCFYMAETQLASLVNTPNIVELFENKSTLSPRGSSNNNNNNSSGFGVENSQNDPTTFREGLEEGAVISFNGAEPKFSPVPPNSPEVDFSKLFGSNSTEADLLCNAAAYCFSYLHQDKVLSALDPNTIAVSPTCFAEKEQELRYQISFKNEGRRGATRVVIEADAPEELKESPIISAMTSIGNITNIEFVNAINSGSVERKAHFRFTIENLYLTGTGESIPANPDDALAPGDGQARARRTSLSNSVSAPRVVHQGLLTYSLITNKNKLRSGRPFEAEAQIIFNSQPPIITPQPARATYNPGGCRSSSFRLGIRAGVNFPLSYQLLEGGAIQDNLLIGLTAEQRLGRSPFSLRGELTYNRLGFTYSNGDLRMDGLEAALQIRTLLFNRLSMGLGGSYYRRLDLEESGQEPCPGCNKFDQSFWGGFADLNYHLPGRRLNLGLRMNAYFEPIIASQSDDILWVPQAYIQIFPFRR